MIQAYQGDPGPVGWCLWLGVILFYLCGVNLSSSSCRVLPGSWCCGLGGVLLTGGIAVLEKFIFVVVVPVRTPFLWGGV